jgi:hypothetical protein
MSARRFEQEIQRGVFSVPNGGSRSPPEAAVLKGLGPLPVTSFSGLSAPVLDGSDPAAPHEWADFRAHEPMRSH